MMGPLHLTLRNFKRDQRAVSAVEFALLAPLMIGLYLGGVEISEAIGIDRKVTLTAGAIANLSAQVSSITATDMTNIMDAGSAIIAPYSTSTLKITVSCLNIGDDSVPKVKWSETRNGTKLAVNSTVSIPSDLVVKNSQLLYSQVSYSYTPTVGYILTGPLNLSDKMYMSPRISAPTYGTTSCSS
jgi:Flp pilus assembly protein TadG